MYDFQSPVEVIDVKEWNVATLNLEWGDVVSYIKQRWVQGGVSVGVSADDKRLKIL
jgi:hypothetical protein